MITNQNFVSFLKNQLIPFLKKNRAIIFFFLILFLIVFANSLHEEYPDEYDSLVGGKYILQGKLPYKDWFQHHQPGAYVLSSLILPFSGINFVKFRIIFAIFIVAINIFGYFIIQKRIQTKSALRFYPFFLLSLAISSTYFWFQMLLADTLSMYFFIPAFGLIFIKLIYAEKFELKDLIIVGIFSFFTWFTSMTYIYLVLLLCQIAFIAYLRDEKSMSFIPKAILGFRALIFPYAIFLIYLLLTKSLPDYYFSTFTYNQNFYIYNAAHEVGKSINPMRYAITIATSFINNFAKTLNFYNDFEVTNSIIPALSLGGVSTMIFLLIKRKVLPLTLLLLALIFACARSNPVGIRETDYQSAIYIAISLFSGSMMLFMIKKDLDDPNEKISNKIILSFVFLLLLIHVFFLNLSLSINFMNKYYLKYMGQAPLIYNRPQVANFVNQITRENEFAWIGPFEFKELFYLKSKIPSRYHWFLQHAAVSKIKNEMIADFKQNRPIVIVFHRNYAPWGGTAHDYNYFFTDFLDKYYFQIPKKSPENTFGYAWKISNTMNFNFNEDFNFDKLNRDEIINRLLRLGYIEKI